MTQHGDARPVKFTVDELVAEYKRTGEAIAAGYEADAERELWESAQRTREAAWRERMCPARFHGAELGWTAAQHGPDVMQALCGWRAADPRTNLVLLGPVGTGKTGSALALLRDDWISHGQEVQFWPVVDLLRGLRPDGGLDVERLMRVPRLLLDDLGAERPTDWTAEQMYGLVNRRWLDQLPTIVTSNLEPAALAEAVGERLFSRLIGDGAVVVKLAGKDRRRARD